MVRGGLAAGGLMFAGAALRIGDVVSASPDEGRRVLSRTESTILGAVITAAFPGGDMPAGDPGFITPWIDEWLAGTNGDTRFLFRSMLHVLEDYALVSHFSRFSRMPLEARMAELRRWEVTPDYLRRSAFSTIKLILGMAYFEQPGTHHAMGWYLGCAPSHLIEMSRYGDGA